jgi:hypothetical protein
MGILAATKLELDLMYVKTYDNGRERSRGSQGQTGRLITTATRQMDRKPEKSGQFPKPTIN